MTINQNASPYYDDFNASNDYLKILFNPARPVQARELTQIQSILQNQIKTTGDYLFQNGTMVIPGHIFYDDTVQFVQLNTITSQVNIEPYLPSLVGATITGAITGVTATVIWFDVATATDPTTIYVKYTGANGSNSVFQSSENLTTPTISAPFSILPVTTPTGSAAICTIGSGVYYINGYFVGVPKQVISLSKYTNTPSLVVGLTYQETIITAAMDPSLYDNAAGFSNYGAPGADRLQVTLTLSTKSIGFQSTTTSSSTTNFISLLTVNNGNIQLLSNSTQNGAINDALAKRTYDTNGNFVTRKFSSTASNLRSNNRGQWLPNTPYLQGDVVSNLGIYYISINVGYSGSTAPTQTYGVSSDGVIQWNATPYPQRFINDGSINVKSTALTAHQTADSLFSVKISPGNAFVQGYEYEFQAPTLLAAPKARTPVQLTASQVYAPTGSYVSITNVKGIPNVSSILMQINLLNTAGTVIGTAWVRSMEYQGGIAVPATALYNLFLFGVTMTGTNQFVRDVHSITDVTGLLFSANINLTLSQISGSVTAAASTAVVGTGTFFTLTTKIGEQVLIGGTWVTIVSITDDTHMTVSASVTATNGTIYGGNSVLTTLGNYITPLQFPGINTLRTSTGTIDMQYIVYKTYTLAPGISTITLTGGETFQAAGHIVVYNSGTLATSLPVNVTYGLNTGATILTITGLNPAYSYYVLGVVQRTGSFAKEKSKSIATMSMDLNNASTPTVTNGYTNQTFAARTIILPRADCSRIIKVTESGDPTGKVIYQAAGEVDITSYFLFDGGQRPEFYDVGRLYTTRNNTRPIRVTFEYYTHSVGDYFSKDSYSSIPLSMIPTTVIAGTSYYLPDCLDFRSSIGYNSGTNTFSFDSTLTGASNIAASISDPLNSAAIINTSYSYFAPRTDTFGIDKSGTMTYNIGKSFDSVNGMQLGLSNIAPLTSNPSTDVSFTNVQISGYTMQDIANLDSRLTVVEDYVALSQLESLTLGQTIKDPSGVTLSNYGYLVDSFADQSVCDITNSDFKAAIDGANGVCRALCSEDGIQLIEPLGITDAARAAAGYQVTGNIASMIYTETPVVSQTYATTPEFLQVYVSLSYIGRVTLLPNTDNYTDNQYKTVNTYVTLPKITTTSTVYNSVNRNGGYIWRYGWYGYYNYWNYYNRNNVKTTTSTSVSSSTSSNTFLGNTSVTDTFYALPTDRARTVVIAATGLMPLGAIHCFMSNNLIDSSCATATLLTVSSVTGTFKGYTSNQTTDNIIARTTSVNSYDTILNGDVIKCAAGGTAVVISDETVVIAGVTKRVLYVINIRGTLSGVITGSLSGAIATIASTTSSVAGSLGNINSNGNLYGVFNLPAGIYQSGANALLLTDSLTSDLSRATSIAGAGYFSNGQIDLQTTNLTYDTQQTVNVATTNTTINTTYYSYWYWNSGA